MREGNPREVEQVLEEPDLDPDSTYAFNHYIFIALTLYCLDCYVSAQISLSCR